LFGVALFFDCHPIFSTPLLLLSVCNAVRTDFIA